MDHPKHLTLTVSILLVAFQLASSNKNARPVYEVINEQSRIDDRVRISSSPGLLPYGNPLAGNSIQNARLHASNQQAMFNAERIRQHKAQLQRQANLPRVVDSYMQAYHESQESHHLALERQQATINDNPTTKAPVRPQHRQKQRVQINKRVHSTDPPKLMPKVTNRGQSRIQNLPKRDTLTPGPEVTKITKEDAIENRNRNYRSYGPVDYQQYLEPQKYRTVYVTPTTDNDQAVSIKDNLNVLGHLNSKTPTKLYTEAISSDSKYGYPKHYTPTQNLKSIQDIQVLNSLLTKNPVDQLTEFNALITSSAENDKKVPIDLYFYVKDPNSQSLSQEQSKYAPNSNSYIIPSDLNIKDHTPITEDVDDIGNPIEDQQYYSLQTIPTTKASEATTTKNNYYKVEVASQTITVPKQEEYNLNDPTYQISHYGQTYGKNDAKSEQYLNLHSQPTGVQHLSGDGTEVSAYGDDDVSIPKKLSISIHIRQKRSKLDTSPFLFTDEKTQSTVANCSDAPTSESLIRINPLTKKRTGDFNVFLSPNFPVGEAADYNDDYDYQQLNSKRSKQKLESFYDDDYYDDFSSDYDSPRQYFPPQSEPKGYPSRTRNFRRSPISQLYGNPPATSYGVPIYGTSVFSTAQTFIPPKLEVPTLTNQFPNVIEPVYMLTQTQLKELVGHHNLNIEHLDVYQLLKENRAKKTPYYPRKYRKRNPFRHLRSNLHKLNKFHLKYAANYEFGYRVRDANTANYYGHRESRNGLKTKGQYHVLLPDGRMQQVNYVAGPEGYHADITYDQPH
nr:uncharacterized protein LOC116775780 isoform X2 [Danaus plexippus plexippus]